MRQYAGFATAAESNRRYHQLIDSRETGLSVAFDLPTQMGYDSDHPVATVRSARSASRSTRSRTCDRLFDGIPLDQVSTSMTINAPAALLLLLYQLVAEEQGAVRRDLAGRFKTTC